MSDTAFRFAPRWPFVLGVVLVAAGVAAVSWLNGRSEPAPSPTVTVAPDARATGDHTDQAGMAMDATPADGGTTGATVTLTPELVRRAGIATGTAGTTVAEVSLRLPGEVAPDGYRSVSVTPLVAGRVTEVTAALGDRVRAGETIARIYSPELTAAQTALLGRQAELEAHEQQFMRTERLLDIGAASQQELDHVHAEHIAMMARVEEARSVLELLGLSRAGVDALADPSDVSSVADVPAPIDGVIVERRANVGLNVDASMSLFTVVDLSSVWVLADLFERDFTLVREGTRAVVTTAAYPDYRFDGRVSYIDPQVQRETRTARLRVEVPNADGRLRLGMYVDVSLIAASDAAVVVVPAEAVQAIGARNVVYAPGSSPGTFVEREVGLGRRWDDLVEIVSGLAPGEELVVEGAFFLRAERERMVPGAGAPAAHPHE